MPYLSIFPGISKFRYILFLIMGIVFIFYCYIFVLSSFYITKAISVNFIMNEFKNYEKNTFNLKCPALNESEWKIYKNLTTPNVFVTENERLKLSIKDLGFVSFTSKDHMKEAIACCKSILLHPELKNIPLTTFLHDDVNQNLTTLYQVECPIAKIIKFPFAIFPKNVRIMEHYRFKAIHEAMAFKNHKVLLSFDTSAIFNSDLNFTALIESSIKTNPTDVTLLTSSNHNMFSTIYPKMYDCFPTVDPKKMLFVPQSQSGLILWIGTENGWKAMRRFVECSLQPSCIAPPGATKICNIKEIYKNQTKFSGCHRFDQAAINLILYENSNFNFTLYQRKSIFFSVVRGG